MDTLGTMISYVTKKGNEKELCIEDLNGKILQRVDIKGCRDLCCMKWVHTDKHILIPQDTDGDENSHIYCLDIVSGKIKDLTPFLGSKVKIQKLSKNFPEEIIILCNKNDNRWFDAYRLNIITEKMEIIFQNTEYKSFVFDDDFNLRLLCKSMENGSDNWYWFNTKKNKAV